MLQRKSEFYKKGLVNLRSFDQKLFILKNRVVKSGNHITPSKSNKAKLNAINIQMQL